MKASYLALLLATAFAQNVTLTTESKNSALNNLGLSGIHEGAGINGVYLVSGPTSFPVENGTVSQPIDSELPFYSLGEFYSTLVFAIPGIPSPAAEVSNGYLTINGSDSVFYACKPGVPYDPYSYSKSSYGVALFAEGAAVPNTCEAIKIKVSSESGSSSSAVTSAASTPTSAVAQGGATVTEEVTKYTTIECSTPTTFAYGNSTYTVSSATTLTVSDCGCTVSAISQTPKIATTATPTAPTVANGAPILNVGAAAAFGAAGLLML